MRQLSKLLLALAVFGLIQWPLLGQAKKDDTNKKDPPKSEGLLAPKTPPVLPCTPGGPCLKHLDNQKLIFTVNQEGDSSNLTDNLSDLAGDLSLNLRIQRVTWSQEENKRHDFRNHPAQLKAACRLAGWTRLIRKDCPMCEIYYIGHSAGARIVLAAAEMLPENTLNGIILIAPGVSSTYDLRPALSATCGDIVNFWSTEDDYLERIVERSGTSEGSKGSAAGRVGFRVPPWIDAKGCEDYKRVRQFRWHEELCGNGGHCAWILKHNLKKCLLPFLNQAPHFACETVTPPDKQKFWPSESVPPPGKIPSTKKPQAKLPLEKSPHAQTASEDLAPALPINSSASYIGAVLPAQRTALPVRMPGASQ